MGWLHIHQTFFSESGAIRQQWKWENGTQMDGDCSYMPVKQTLSYSDDDEVYFRKNGMILRYNIAPGPQIRVVLGSSPGNFELL